MGNLRSKYTDEEWDQLENKYIMERKQFQYLIINDFGDVTQEEITELGTKGWELVSIACNSKYNALYFKRELI